MKMCIKLGNLVWNAPVKNSTSIKMGSQERREGRMNVMRGGTVFFINFII